MNKKLYHTIALTSMLMTFLANSARAQDHCSHYRIFDLRDTLIQGNPNVSFQLTIDTVLPGSSTGYTSMFFVDAVGDTLNPLTWSQNVPTGSPMWDTVPQILSYINGFSSFPQDFDGFLMMRNPDCAIPFQRSAVGIDEPKMRNATLHPNPSNGWVTIRMDGGTSDIENLEVLDALGRRVFQLSFKGASRIDLTKLLPGQYTVRGWSDGRLLFAEPLVKE